MLPELEAGEQVLAAVAALETHTFSIAAEIKPYGKATVLKSIEFKQVLGKCLEQNIVVIKRQYPTIMPRLDTLGSHLWEIEHAS